MANPEMPAARRWPNYDESPVSGMLPLDSVDGFAAASWLQSGYLNFQWRALPTLTITPGIRVADSSLVGSSVWPVGPRELGVPARLESYGLGGSVNQFPDFEHVMGPAGSPGLRPERAAHGEVGIGRRFASSMRWQVEPVQPTRARCIVHQPSQRLRGSRLYAAPFRLSATKMRSKVHRRHRADARAPVRAGDVWLDRLWDGKSRQTDVPRNETFWAELDQRHALNVSAVYRSPTVQASQPPSEAEPIFDSRLSNARRRARAAACAPTRGSRCMPPSMCAHNGPLITPVDESRCLSKC